MVTELSLLPSTELLKKIKQQKNKLKQHSPPKLVQQTEKQVLHQSPSLDDAEK